MTSEKLQFGRINPLLPSGVICVCLAAGVLVAIWSDVLATGSLSWTNTDFSNYWIASRLVLEGQAIDLFSGQDTYFRHMQAAFGPDYDWHNWSYPPSFLLMIWPLGLMPHAVSMVVFLLLTVILFLHSISVVEQGAHAIVPILLSMFLICNGYLAQNGFLTAALLLYGLGLRERFPLLAGVAFGLLTVKPQLGLLIPLLLLYERRWPVILSASVTALLLIALSTLLFGFDSWRGYLEHNIPYQGRVMAELSGVFLYMMPSTFGYVRSLGSEAGMAMMVHMPVAGLALVAFIWGLTQVKNQWERSLILLLATFLISPYALIYDMGALAAVAAVTFARTESVNGADTVWTFLLSATALLSVLHPFLAFSFSLPVAPVVLWLCLLMLLIRRGVSEH
ncbi:glycosyltransferase family 87 protein [Rhizobium sp. WL3]|uniref:glycosyltransferase family 87 protein n=1 Tax=Rhizobium sp. WL3 TaxID=2603277 RepID=UPI0016502C75|nr:glycosyltransferase family 87 protein [Rhizobium sp. WL3]